VGEKFPQAREHSQKLPRLYKAVAEQLGCGFLNTQDLIQPAAADGIHLDAAAHDTLGRAVAAQVRQMLA
jgi:lysophospholipase L1-like esterase